MSIVYLSLGSNLGNRKDNINKALDLISKRVGKVITHSSLYETKPLDFDSNNMFINSVCAIKTELSPMDLLKELRQIEVELGRDKKTEYLNYQDRIIDIDILLYEDLSIENNDLKIPHPRMHKRKFVLEPFAEIAPNAIHPTFNKSIKELLEHIKNHGA